MRNFKDIIDNITEGTSAAHAYIIEGRAGAARERFICRLAAGLECLEPDTGARPCGRCSACRQAAAGSSLDIIHMQMSGKTGYKTEDANAFAERLDMGAYGRFLIGIIDDADSLSEVVQNKLLKTLEEPRDRVILLLGSANPDSLLSTVRSRCSMIRLQDHAGDTDADACEEPSDDRGIKEAASLLAGSSFCGFRDAIGRSVRSRDDALLLIDMAEDDMRERMLSGDDAEAMAVRIGIAETARMDIQRDMDKNKALKRLFLELSGR